MKTKSSLMFLGALAAVCMVVFAPHALAADSPDRLEGRVHTISTDGKTLTLHVSNPPAASMNRYVALTADTKYTFQNQPGTFDQVKEGLRVICVGKFDENGKLIAERVDVRKRQ